MQRLGDLFGFGDLLGYDRKSAKVWVFVNGTTLTRDDGTLDSEVLEKCLARLSRLLASWPNSQQGSVYFSVLCRTPTTMEAPRFDIAHRIISYCLEGVAQRAGFLTSYADVRSLPSPPDWESLVSDFTSSADEDREADESALGDELVKVYPVRTATSRYEWRGADCVIHIVTPIHTYTAEIVEKVRQSMRRYVWQGGLCLFVRRYQRTKDPQG
ncbi:MAG: hypothetical protein ACYTG0_19380 [Planctomycetota bacterium]